MKQFFCVLYFTLWNENYLQKDKDYTVRFNKQIEIKNIIQIFQNSPVILFIFT